MRCGPEEHRLDCSITEASLVFEEQCQGLKGPKNSGEGEEVQTVCADHTGKPCQTEEGGSATGDGPWWCFQ